MADTHSISSHPKVSHSQSATVQRSVRFPADDYAALVTLAALEERSVSQVVKRAVRSMLRERSALEESQAVA